MINGQRLSRSVDDTMRSETPDDNAVPVLGAFEYFTNGHHQQASACVHADRPVRGPV